MSAPLWLTTEEQRQRLFLARRRGGMCAGCGRSISDEETVYIEQFFDDRGSRMQAPVGVECASEQLLHDTQGRDPEHCAGCGQEVYYRVAHRRRQQALCSRPCAAQAQATRRQKAEG